MLVLVSLVHLNFVENQNYTKFDLIANVNNYTSRCLFSRFLELHMYFKSY